MPSIGTDEGSISLEVVDYEFPDIKDDPHWYDSNWLKIKVKAKTSEHDIYWERTDPCLLTTELQKLTDWFNGILHGKRSKKISFIEPCIEISRNRKAGKTYSFDFELSGELSYDSKKKVVKVYATREDIEKFCKELGDEYSKFPRR